MAEYNGMPYGVPDQRRDRRGDYDRGRDDRGRSDRDHRRGRDDEDRHRSSRHRSPEDRDRRSTRSKSRSRTPPRRTRKPRKSQWDILPPDGVPLAPINTGQPAPIMAAAPVAAPLPIPAPIIPIPGVGAVPLTAVALPGLGGQSHSQQATRHARRVYVGGLPPTANEQSVATFFSHALAAVGGTAAPGNAVVNVYINKDKNFAFVEFRTVEETSNAMGLDGIMFEGVSVRVRRPNDYNPAAAALLGPSNPSPNLNLAAIGLQPAGGAAGGSDASERVFVGGLPYYLSEEQCRELLGSFGIIKSFDLVKDRETGNSKGYGFVVYGDPGVTDIACAGLNGLKMGDRTLTVRRATEGAPRVDTGGGVGDVMTGVTSLSGATRIVILNDSVEIDELRDEEEYNDIMQDMLDECKKYGDVRSLQIPRPTPDQPHPHGLGKVIIEYLDVNAAVKARNAMHGRKFGGKVVQAAYLSEEKFASNEFTM